MAKYLYFIFLIFFAVSCGESIKKEPLENVGSKPNQQNSPKMIFVGDSLVAGYGVDTNFNFVSLLKKEIEKRSDYVVVNAGISGETSSGTLSRVEWLLESKPSVIFLCIGSNDGLRGIDVETYQKNLKEIINKIRSEHVKLILSGIRVPPNYGEKYGSEMSNVPISLSKEYGLLFYPFLLDGVAGDFSLNQSDGVHPNEKGHQVIFEKLLNFMVTNKIIK